MSDPADDLVVREYAAADLDAVVAVWHRTKRAAYPFLPLEQARTMDEDREFFLGRIAPGCRTWVCVERGEIRGYVALRGGDYVDRLYVDVAHQRRGIGRRLLAAAARESPGVLRLHTHVENTAGRAFYERLGFRAAEFGRSPPPEDAPDVLYVWRSASGGPGAPSGATFPALVDRIVARARERFGGDYLATYLWGGHARGDAIETSDLDVGVFVRGDLADEARRRVEDEFEAALADRSLDFALVAEGDLDGRDAVSFRYGALRVDGADLRERLPLPSREEWADLAEDAALHWIARSRNAPLALPLPPIRADDPYLGYLGRTLPIGGRDVPSTKEALSIAGRIATARVARASGRFVGDRPQAIRAYAEDVADSWAPYLGELQQSLRRGWRYRVPTTADDRAVLRRLCEQTLEFERSFVARLAEGPRGPRTDRAWREARSQPADEPSSRG